MNIYKIIFSHNSSKDYEIGLICFLVAPNDEAVFNWILSEPKVNGNIISTGWKNQMKDYEKYDNWSDVAEKYIDGEFKKFQDFKSWIIHIKGDIFNDEIDFDDAHYSITLYGWELMHEDCDDMILKIQEFLLYGQDGYSLLYFA